MEFLNMMFEPFKSFGFLEWGMVALIIILLFMLIFFNKGVLKCKDKLEEYEREIRAKDKLLTQFEVAELEKNERSVDC